MSLTVGQALDAAAHELAVHGDAEQARRDAQVLLGHALDVSRAWLGAHREDVPDPVLLAAARRLVQERAMGRPVAYLLGRREFFGLEFQVTADVLIPRPETELLVDAALERLPENGPCSVLDLGTGSGCVAIAIASRRRQARVVAVDRSDGALKVARDNAGRLKIDVEFRQGDWFAGLAQEHFDLIVSNPPYVAAGDPHLGRGDLRFEPRAALVAGPDGLADIRRIVARAPVHLRPGGWLLFEHGHDQAGFCRDLIHDAGFEAVLSLADLAGLARVAGGQLPRMACAALP